MTKIKELRVANGIKQGKLAEILNISQANLSAWELGKWQPDIDAIINIAQYFGVTTDYLLGVSSLPYGANATYEIELAPEQEDERRVLDLYRTVKEKGGNEAAIKFIDLLSELLLKKGE